jgi:hypothetical protein
MPSIQSKVKLADGNTPRVIFTQPQNGLSLAGSVLVLISQVGVQHQHVLQIQLSSCVQKNVCFVMLFCKLDFFAEPVYIATNNGFPCAPRCWVPRGNCWLASAPNHAGDAPSTSEPSCPAAGLQGCHLSSSGRLWTRCCRPGGSMYASLLVSRPANP